MAMGYKKYRGRNYITIKCRRINNKSMNKITETFKVGWGSVILAALSAWYFGWLAGRKETLTGLIPGEITIENQKILIPAVISKFLLK